MTCTFSGATVTLRAQAVVTIQRSTVECNAATLQHAALQEAPLCFFCFFFFWLAFARTLILVVYGFDFARDQQRIRRVVQKILIDRLRRLHHSGTASATWKLGSLSSFERITIKSLSFVFVPGQVLKIKHMVTFG